MARFETLRTVDELDGAAPGAKLNASQWISNGRVELDHAVVDHKAHPNQRIVCRTSAPWAIAITNMLNERGDL